MCRSVVCSLSFPSEFVRVKSALPSAPQWPNVVVGIFALSFREKTSRSLRTMVINCCLALILSSLYKITVCIGRNGGVTHCRRSYLGQNYLYMRSLTRKNYKFNSHLDAESVRVARPGLVSASVASLEWLMWTSRPGAVDPI